MDVAFLTKQTILMPKNGCQLFWVKNTILEEIFQKRVFATTASPVYEPGEKNIEAVCVSLTRIQKSRVT